VKALDPITSLPSVVAAVAAVDKAKYALIVQTHPFGGDSSVRVIAVGKKQKEVKLGNLTVAYDTHGKPKWPHILDSSGNEVYFEGVVYSVKGVA